MQLTFFTLAGVSQKVGTFNFQNMLHSEALCDGNMSQKLNVHTFGEIVFRVKFICSYFSN